ncbi:MAG: hypothetical protein L0Z63_09490 [Actinobacteria bacterium]|nr:hypothetical protein [Actinomycetota bacterium]
MPSDLILASDLGSGACKTVLIDARGRVRATAHREYPTFYPRPGWAEQDPDDWFTAFAATVVEVLDVSEAKPEDILAVGIVGVTHNAILLDAQQRPLGPSILMFDARSAAEVQSIKERWGPEVGRRTLNSVSTVWTWPHLEWVRRHRPEAWSSAAHIVFQKDYVRNRLAPSLVTDHIEASGTLLFDPVEGVWIDDFLTDLGLSQDRLPDVVDPGAVVGAVGAEGASATGLLVGTPVIAGTTDTVAEMVGSAAVVPGAATIKLASVGRIALVTKDPIPAPSVLNYRHVFEGLWYPGTASKYAASAYRWLREAFWPELADAADAYELMDEAASSVPAGAEGLIFHPHLNGQWAPYWDDELRGAFLGVTSRHSKAHFTRATLEGVAFAIRDALDSLSTLGPAIEDLRLIGRGARSHLWTEVLSNVIARPLSVPAQVDAAFGSALITAMSVGVIDHTPEAIRRLAATTTRRVEPATQIVGIYEALFEQYRDSVSSIRSVSKGLFDFERAHDGRPRQDGPNPVEEADW